MATEQASTEPEEWRPVVGYEGLYSISNHGRLRRDAHTGIHKNGTRMFYKAAMKVGSPVYEDGRLCKLTTGLWKNNVEERKSIHALVAESFIGPRPEGMEVCHWDGDPTHNHVSNLRYDTRQGNVNDAKRHGRIRKGDRHPHALLNDDQVREIIALLHEGRMTHQEIGTLYGVHQGVISAIRCGSWEHIERPEGFISKRRPGRPASKDYTTERPFQRGEDCAWSRFTEESVRELKRRLREGASQAKLAREYGVSQSAISAIWVGKNWSHVD